MKIDIIKGIYTDGGFDYHDAYPRNMMVVPQDTGLSTWYLRPAEGIRSFAIGPSSPDRGGVNWRGKHYRVMGSFLCEISAAGVAVVLGSLAGVTTGQVTFDYSIDKLSIASSGLLYYWNGTTLLQVLDPDLGVVLDVVWVDGYFMTTDGISLVVTELNDPFAVNPLKYGSSEADSDPVVALLKIKNEVYALNRHTIELFDNVGGNLFPFARIEGAQIQKGCVGTHACAVFMDMVAFIGGGRNEPPSIYVGVNSTAQKISTREIDRILLGYSELILSKVIVETRVYLGDSLLYIHLPDQALVFNGTASRDLGFNVWTVLASSIVGKSIYRARNFVWCYDRWFGGDPASSKIGVLDDSRNTHYGTTVGWEFSTPILYNGGRGAVMHSLELVCLPGRELPQLLNIIASGGGTHSLAIKPDGTLWVWGSNDLGQLGDGAYIAKNVPTKVGSDTNWAEISTGEAVSLAKKTDGTLWAWGNNSNGQLGDGTTILRNTPTNVGSDTNWAEISTGEAFSLAKKTDGTLWAWGNNANGQLGDGTNIAKNAPIKVGSDTNWAEISAGELHSLAKKTDGTLWAWGNNTNSQLGDGTNIAKNTPIKVGSDTNWVKISAGELHSLAKKTDGTLWAWGNNANGQLGDGTTILRNAPTKVGSDTNWAKISAGEAFSLATKTDGTLWAWGNNGNGQLGNGTTVDKNVPTKVGSDTNWAEISAGALHSLAGKTDGTLWSWGNNGSGRLGNGTVVNSSSPINII